MAGQYVLIRNRWTYFPHFVNEHLTGNLKDPKGKSLSGKPFWSCTFTALMYGVNFGYLGNKPAQASQQHIVQLAIDSGDDDLRGGGTTSLMQKALTVRYQKTVKQEAVGPKTIRERLGSGQMVVAGIRSVDLSDHFRRFVGNTGALHRAAFVGLRTVNGQAQTRILDPMAVPSPKNYPKPEKWAGEWFPLTDYSKAAFSNQQLWFEPGGFLDRIPLKVHHRFDLPRTLTVRKGATIVGFDRRRPERKVLQIMFPAKTELGFDLHVSAKVEGVKREYLSIADGPLKTLFVRRDDPGLDAEAALAGAVPAAADDVVELPDLVEIFDPTDIETPGKEAPLDDRSTPLDAVPDDDPADVAPPEEDASAVPAEAF
jgi:hypothetical protein